MTARQLSKKTEMMLDSCSYVLWELSVYKLAECLNKNARRSRLYWLTKLGAICQRRLREKFALPSLTYDMEQVDWDLYGWVCFSHRSAVLKALDKPMQPATIKRNARFHNPDLRMSANNVRDIIKLFLVRGIVAPVKVRGRAHLRYKLTEMGEKLRNLLFAAESKEQKVSELLDPNSIDLGH